MGNEIWYRKGYFRNSLKPLEAADEAYRRGRETLVMAVESHNHAVAAGSISFADARRKASSAASSLQQVESSLSAMRLEGLDLGVASTSVASLESTAQKFIEACRKGESNDAAGHNRLMAEVQSELSASSAATPPSIDVLSWLRPQLESLMRPVLDDLEEVRALLNGT